MVVMLSISIHYCRLIMLWPGYLKQFRNIPTYVYNFLFHQVSLNLEISLPIYINNDLPRYLRVPTCLTTRVVSHYQTVPRHRQLLHLLLLPNYQSLLIRPPSRLKFLFYLSSYLNFQVTLFVSSSFPDPTHLAGSGLGSTLNPEPNPL